MIGSMISTQEYVRFKRHRWDTERASVEEFCGIANRLLGHVGGSIGTKAEKPAKDHITATGSAQKVSKRKSTDDSMSRDSPVQQEAQDGDGLKAKSAHQCANGDAVDTSERYSMS
ncbi:MAG: hypothetical protein J3R72DRAFT_421078 [Linnemannia gamsii]|nr:MAG: hypothetical protein J3R72DRAFT_421078 [Linnemannia gamsii]